MKSMIMLSHFYMHLYMCGTVFYTRCILVISIWYKLAIANSYILITIVTDTNYGHYCILIIEMQNMHA